MTSPNELKRPRELEFALEFCGNPEETIARQYIEALEARAALAQPEPEGVTARELQWPPSVAQGCHEAAAEAEPGSPMQQLLVAAGDLLENYARPAIQPVPVAEDQERLRIMEAGIRYGYKAGHHDTVEACYGDPDNIAADYAPEILKEMQS
jgi:hypothetical protein